MHTQKVAVVILNWNGKHFLTQFLPPLVAYTPQAILYLVDNSSTDGSVEWVQQMYANVHIIKHSQNEGFCRGYNLALKKIEADIYVLINSDVEVTENWLNPLLDYLQSHHQVAACQPKIKSFHDRCYFEYAGACGGYLDRDAYPFCRGRIFDVVEEDVGQYNTAVEITWASGACLAIKAPLFHQIGGFDEDFFAHMEEIDLCVRLIAQGQRIACVPQSEVYHVGAGTLSKNSSFKTYLNFRNNLYLIHKHVPSHQLFLFVFKRLCMDGLAGFLFLSQAKWTHVFAIIRAHFTYYSKISLLNKKRNGSGMEKIQWLKHYSIVHGYKAKGKTKFTDYI